MKYFAQAFLSLILLFALASGTVQWGSACQFHRGMIFYQNQDWYHAIGSFQRANSLFGRDPEIHRYLAKSYLHLVEGRNPESRLSLLRKAQAELLEAIAIEKDYPYYWALLGRVGELMEGMKEAPLKRPEECYHQALILDPNNPLFLQLFAQFLIQGREEEQAKPLIAKMAQLDPSYAHEAAVVWLKRKYPPEELIPLFSSNLDALGSLTNLLEQMGYLKLAVQTAQKAMEIAPGRPEALLIYGDALSQSGQCPAAGQTLAPLMTNPAYEVKARWIYSICLFRQKDYDLLEKQYLRLIAIQPESLEYRWYLANLYLIKQQPELAKAHLLWLFNQPGLTNPELKARVVLHLAVISETELQFAPAFKYYQIYLKLKPSDPRIQAKVDQLKGYGSGDIIYSLWGKDDE